ncbi:DNA recombination protein RecN [Carbonactinospora thermoautotrophica]|uniref:DNA repair protein RecN n=5 Tax=Carbonactinospora thermoautotrophica TaxID=1469144 RepID=A0A132N516_9ACTN|nr:DNA repair protein RecN [Carbonactinospora thermoautotrophica]KWX05241.1 DNA recombination protein RecN [Carbonactinospora thermoautotrophica]
MLLEMRIRGLGVIDDALLKLSRGFTVITGETGAGKTMVVTGLGLLFGGRGDSSLVRPGANGASVEGRIAVDPAGPAAARALEAGAELDDDELLITRTISAEGRSRAYLGGRAVPVGVLGELAGDLIAVHGQSEQQQLLNPARQRAALDRYAGEAVAVPLSRYVTAYERLREVTAQLHEITARARERAQEADLLRYGLAEIEAAAPQPGEDAELAAEIERLSHADALKTAATGAHEALLGDPAAADGVDAVGLVGAARSALEHVRHHDPALAELADRLAEVSYLLSDVATDLASYAENVDADPARLAALQERQATLTGLMRKYGDTIEDVLAWAEQAGKRLADLEGDDERVDELQAEQAELRAELSALAAEISAARRAAAERFGAAVTAELTQLAMPHARVQVAVSRTEDPDGLEIDGARYAYGPHGVDDVEILLTPHPGAVPRPLAKGASGGELSRVMLAVEVVFAGADPVPTFVFDEVDAGVGGKAAVEIGKRLAKLARSAQVIVVTHLPQVAAFADRHLLVVKADDGTVTRSGVIALDEEERVRELSRMLAGLEDSELARAHAEELLAAAAAAKAQ